MNPATGYTLRRIRECNEDLMCNSALYQFRPTKNGAKKRSDMHDHISYYLSCTHVKFKRVKSSWVVCIINNLLMSQFAKKCFWHQKFDCDADGAFVPPKLN